MPGRSIIIANVRAKYSSGAFTPLDIAEGAEVTLVIE